jgi:hypothetical protein
MAASSSRTPPLLPTATDSSTDASPTTATGSGAGSPRDADGVLTVSLGPAAGGRPDRGRRRVGTVAHQALVF